MIKRIKFKSNLLRSILVLMTGTLASQLINVALSIPLYRYFYTPVESAEWGLFMRIVAVGGALATARYEFALPVAKADVHSFRLYRIALRISIKVLLITGIASLIPLLFLSDINDIIFYLLLPIALFLTAYYSIGTNWAIRKKRYKSISLSKIAAATAGGGSKLLFGWVGTGYIGLIIGTVFGMLVSNYWFFRDFLTLNKKYEVKSNSPRNKALAKEYNEFPKVNLPHALMDVGRDLLVAILLVKIFTKEDFGLFDQSYRMLRLPLGLAGLAIGQVFFQRSAEKYANKEDILPMILKSVRALFLISIVPFSLIFFFGDELFASVFGEQWRGAGEFSEIMAPWFMMNFIASPLSFLPLVLRKQRQFFLIAASGSLAMILSIVIPSMFFHSDVKLTLWALSLSQVVYFLFVIYKILSYVRKSPGERELKKWILTDLYFGVMNKINRGTVRMKFKLKGVKLGNRARIHRSVDFDNPQNALVGDASILYKNISILIGVEGSFKIGSNSHIAPYGYLLIDRNRLEMGDHVAIGPFCTFVCHSNHTKGESEFFSQNYLDGDIIIGNNVFIGAQCTILPGTIIEDNVVVASNSVVSGRLESNAVYGGSPAKKIKDLNDAE